MIELSRVVAAIRDVPDFPSPGITFKDISPLLGDPELFAGVVAAMAEPFADAGVDVVAGIEARGFIFGAPVAQRLGAGFVPVRKAGKLPSATLAESYALEYGTATVEVHADAFDAAGVDGPARVLIVDDVLATGGTAAAAAGLVARTGATAVGCAFLIELGFLGGRDALALAHPGLPVEALLRV